MNKFCKHVKTKKRARNASSSGIGQHAVFFGTTLADCGSTMSNAILNNGNKIY